MQHIITLVAGVLGAACLMTGLTAEAQTIPFLDMSVMPPVQIAAPGEGPFWSIELTNNNPDTAYFVFTGFADGLGAVPDVSVPAYNPTPFGQQYTLAPNASLTIPDLFQTVISPSAATATYNSSAEAVYDLYDSSAFTNPLLTDVTASGDWTLRVLSGSASTPEPGTFAFLTSVGAVVVGGIVRRQRR
jgi:hypothetical protein